MAIGLQIFDVALRWQIQYPSHLTKLKRKGPKISPEPFLILVGRAGFEPATNGLKILLIIQINSAKACVRFPTIANS